MRILQRGPALAIGRSTEAAVLGLRTVSICVIAIAISACGKGFQAQEILSSNTSQSTVTGTWVPSTFCQGTTLVTSYSCSTEKCQGDQPANKNEANSSSCTSTPGTVANCSVNGQTIGQGPFNIAGGYTSSTTVYPGLCQSDIFQGTCTNGVVAYQHTPAATSCTPGLQEGSQDCTFNGQVVKNGGFTTGFASSSVPYNSTCSSSQLTCSNGNLLNATAFPFASCAPASAVNCTVNGQAVGQGTFKIASGFTSSTTTYPATCQADYYGGTCNNGTVTNLHTPAAALCTPGTPGTVSTCPDGQIMFNQKCTQLLPANPNVGTAAAPGFGFNYEPWGYGDTWLTTDFAAAQPRIANDIALMKSMGVNVVRLMIMPFALGLPPWQFNQPYGHNNFDLANYNLAAKNLVQVVKIFSTARIRVIPMFTPNTFYWFTPEPDSLGNWPSYVDIQCRDTSIYWWQCRYPNRWSDFVWDFVTWENGLVWEIENDPVASANILYYDLNNEVQFANGPGTDMQALLTTEIENTIVPAGKIGFSLLMPTGSTDAKNLKNLLVSSSKIANYIDVHCYPDVSNGCQINNSIAAWLDKAYQTVRASFPSSQTHFNIGEFGATFDGGKGSSQANEEAQIIAWAKNNHDVSALIHWGLYDDNPSYGVRVGVAPGPDQGMNTRDSYMVLGSAQANLIDGDFENGLAGWFAGGTGAKMATKPASDSVTGTSYGRMTVTGPGFNYLCTPNFVLPDGWYVATGGFIRTAVAGVTIDTHYFDRNWSELSVDSIQLTQPSSSQWRQIQEQSLSKRVALGNKPYAAQVCFGITAPTGTSTQYPMFLDLDAITIFDY